MNDALLVLVVTLVAVITGSASAAETKEFPVGAGGRLFGDFNVDALMSRPYLDHVPMACTGECLWAAHPNGWAFGNGVHYYLLTSHGVGFDLEVESLGQTLAPMDGSFFPSHVRMRGGTGDLRIEGAKWITADDVMGVRLLFTNAANVPASVRLRLSLPSTEASFAVSAPASFRLPSTEASLSVEGFEWTTAQHGLNIVLYGQAAGFQPEPQVVTSYFLTEGEAPVSQSGSTGPDHKAAAISGQVLGSNFGGKEGHRAEWRIDVKEAIPNAVLSIRYARAFAGDAEFKLTMRNGKKVERYWFSQTGGWGDSPNDFKVAAFPLGALDAGAQTVQAIAVSNGCNVNVDALCIHPADTDVFANAQHGSTRLTRTLELQPGQAQRVDVFLAAGTKPEQVRQRLARVAALEDPLQEQVHEYNRWLLENVPRFAADDAMTRQYWHRATSILRKNLFRVGEGRLRRWGVAEGRWNNGWYANMISYGAGHQIRESRWLRDPRYVRDIVSTWCANQKADGVFPSFIHPGNIGGGQYTDWITSTAWDAYCVAPDSAQLREWAEALKKNVDGWLRVYDKDDDGLLLVDSHWWTGMEWQPSFFYFKGFDKDKQDQQLERVDLTAYVYGNAKNLSRILGVLGDAAGEAHYAALANKIRHAVETVMWDKASQYFYSVEPNTHEKAMVKEVIGVYPFYFSMFEPGSRFTSAWSSILNPDEFYTKFPVASASKKCPAYSQDTTFHGKEVGGCMWNGPTWPHANSLALSAMAATLRENKNVPITQPAGMPALPVHAGNFQALLNSFTMEQFKDQVLEFPWTGEYLNGDTGEWRTDERDYNHSTYTDIIIADLAGLRARPDDTLEVHPVIAPETPSFLLDGVRYHGHDITIAWHKPGDTPSPDGLTGLRVYVDGKLKHRSDTVEHVVLPGAVP